MRMKKKSVRIVCVTLIALLLVSLVPATVFAGPQKTTRDSSISDSDKAKYVKQYDKKKYKKSVTVTQQNASNALDDYVTVVNGKLELVIPDDVYIDFEPIMLDAVLQVLAMTNEMITNEEVIVTPNGTLYEANDDLLSIQGGVDKNVKRWFGWDIYCATPGWYYNTLVADYQK